MQVRQTVEVAGADLRVRQWQDDVLVFERVYVGCADWISRVVHV